MAVVLTGDVHHAIPSGDRPYARESEAALAVEYAGIAARHGLVVTLFVTGRAVVDDRADLDPLLTMGNVEIGGHGWDAFYPGKLYAALHRISGSAHGPAFYQRHWTIRRTCGALERWSGRPVRSWRNHSYHHDANTARLLAASGVVAWSDDVDPERQGPYRHEGGVTVLPINTLPDHEYVLHGELTPETAGPDREVYTPGAWCDRVCDQVARLVDAGGTATILAHPLCMKVADDWGSFERLCRFLARYESRTADQAVAAEPLEHTELPH